ncbi:DNA-binding Lrp family transcriptional regulator [Methanomicrobium sp. W14]|uniref:P-loop NTPase n=1 Tax=Methanomicrobium sp. W14 TaxID=2817839 RepID=UPI001AE1650F|nr:hypothetical protein [Methanomicrobium sp. W14]MBP2133986.1 DNA-binding Lrp family transcriptional regulator [Methanomicrobium sp. W14]
MVAEIISSILISLGLTIAKKSGDIIFHNQNMEELFTNSDFKEKLETEIFYEAIPETDTDKLSLFFRSEPVKTIVEEIVNPNDQQLNDLEEDFENILSGYNFEEITLDPELGHKLFISLIRIAKFCFQEEIRLNNNLLAKDALDEIRRKEDKWIKNPKFVSYDKYFPVYETDLLNSRETFSSNRIKNYIEIINQFLENESKNIFIFNSPGGYGKSHIMKAIATTIDKEESKYSVRLIKPTFRDMEDALLSELKENQKYTLLFDDSDRYFEELPALFSYAKNNPSTIKLILTARTAGIYQIDKLLIEGRYDEIVEECTIKEWDSDELKNLLRTVIGKEPYKHEDQIVSHYNNPYLIVTIGKIIKQEPNIKLENIWQKISSELEYDVIRVISPEIGDSKSRLFLADLALLAPLRENEKSILQEFANKYDISEDDIKRIINNLIETGILRKPGYSIRFNPDMKGDLYLAYTIDKLHSTCELKSWIESIKEVNRNKSFINLQAVSHYTEKNYITEIYNDWVVGLIETAKNTPAYERMHALEELNRFCYLIPEESLNLIYTYINTPLPALDPQLPEYFMNFSLSMDNYGPIIEKLIDLDLPLEDIYNLIKKVNSDVPDGRYNNYKIESLIGEMVSPLKKSFDIIQSSLIFLNDKLDENDQFSIDALGAAISKSLEIQHHKTYMSSGMTFTNERIQLSNTPSVIKTRGLAISIIEKMIISDSLIIKRKGIGLCYNINQPFYKSDFSLMSEIAKEVEKILTVIAEILTNETNYSILSDIEKLLFEWWWREIKGSEQSENLLIKFPRTDEYIFHRYLFHSGIELLKFDPNEVPIEKEKRNEWYFQKLHSNFNPKNNKYPELIVESYLNSKYHDLDTLVTFLKEIQAYSLEYEINAYNLENLLSIWIVKNPDLFFHLHEKSEDWNLLLPQIKEIINLQLCKKDPILLENIADDIFSEIDSEKTDIDKIISFIRAISFNSLDGQKVDLWLEKFIEIDNLKVNESIITCIWYLSKNCGNFNILKKHLINILNNQKEINSNFLDHLYIPVIYNLKQNCGIVPEESENELKNEILKTLVKIPDFSIFHNNYHIKEILDYTLSDVNEIVKFIHYRAEEKKENEDYYILLTYEIPFFINLKSYEEFRLLIKETFKLFYEGKILKSEIISQIKLARHFKNSNTDKLYLEDCIEELLKKNKANEILIFFSALPLNRTTKETIIKILEKTIPSENEDKAKRIFYYNINSGGVSFGKNGISEELKNRRDFLNELKESADPGPVRTFLSEVIKEVSQEIEYNKKEYIDMDLGRI